jgi:thymidylate synthase|uniref:DHFR domain-containing protein n=1 Tax=viral metagenome TaxID=1070528 RepID=A0A6C0J1W6_9ZZZZ
MKLILVVDECMGIGYKNGLPWKDKEELKLFKSITTNSTLVCGRKTAENLPYLKDRTLVCITRNKHIDTSNWNNHVIVLNELPENDDNTFIAGGLQIYQMALERPKYITEIYLSIMKNSYESDTFFNKKWLDDFVIEESTEFETFTHYKMIKTKNGERQYINLLEKVLKEGHCRDTRNGITISTFGNQMKFNLQNGFPLLTTKKMFLRGILEEFLFFLKGDTDASYLSDKKVKIWEGNTSKEFLKKCNLDYAEGVMGPMYGYQWRRYNSPYKTDNEGKPIKNTENKGIDQLKEVIDLIINDPHSRRILMTTYNPLQVHEGVLFPCHSLMLQFYVEDKYLDMYCFNRSQDIFLGTPFNIASSSLLLLIIAQLTGKIARNFVMSMGDTHIYSDHIEAVNTQIQRIPYKFPTINIPIISKIEEIYELTVEDFFLENYKSDKAIKAKMVA